MRRAPIAAAAIAVLALVAALAASRDAPAGEPLTFTGLQTALPRGARATARTFATNSLVLAEPGHNPARIRTIQDLTRRPKLRLVVVGQKVPTGRSDVKGIDGIRASQAIVARQQEVAGARGQAIAVPAYAQLPVSGIDSLVLARFGHVTSVARRLREAFCVARA